jgi:hypothetical protein
LLFTACGTRQENGVSVSRVVRRMIPPNARALAGIDIAALKNTAFYKREGRRLNVPLLDATKERLGLDPRHDLSQVVIAWDGKRYLLLVEGKFSPAGLEQNLKAAGAHETLYRKHGLVGDIANSVAVLNPGVVAAGPLETLEPAIDRFEDGGGGVSGVPQNLQQQLDKVSKGSQVWLVSAGGLPFVEIRMRSDIESALSNIVDYVNATNVGLRIDAGLHLQAEISCISEQGAKRVHDAVRGLVGFGRLSTRDKETDLLRIYDSVQVSQRQQIVELRVDLTGDLADSLLNRLQLGNGAVSRPSQPR